MITAIVYWDQLKLQVSQEESNYRYRLYTVNPATGEQTTVMSSLKLPGNEKNSEPVKLFNAVWYISVEPSEGWDSLWRAPLQAVVVVVSFIMSILALTILVNFEHRYAESEYQDNAYIILSTSSVLAEN